MKATKSALASMISSAITTDIGVEASSGIGSAPKSIRPVTTPLALFVTLGLPAGAIGVAWPHMRASLGAPLAGLGLLLAAFTVGYFVASASSGPVRHRLGTAILLMAGCTLASAGTLRVSLAAEGWRSPPAPPAIRGR